MEKETAEIIKRILCILGREGLITEEEQIRGMELIQYGYTERAAQDQKQHGP